MTCWDGWCCWKPDRQAQKGKILQLHWTHHTHRTRRDGTAQRQGAERGESQRGRVRKQSRACISMWWLYGCGCVSVLLPSFSLVHLSRAFPICTLLLPGLCGVHVFCVVCVLMSWASLALCSVGLSSSDDTFKEKRALGFGRGQQFGLALWGQVLQVMSAPNWGG